MTMTVATSDADDLKAPLVQRPRTTSTDSADDYLLALSSPYAVANVPVHQTAAATINRHKLISDCSSSLGLGLPTPPWNLDRNRAMLSLACYCTSFSAVAFIENCFTLYSDALGSYFHVPPEEISIDFTLCVVTYAGTAPIFAWLAEKRGHRLVVHLSLLSSVLAYAGLCYAESFILLHVSFVFGGLAVGCLWAPCISGAISLMPPDKQAPAATAVALSYVVVSSLVSYPLEYFLEHYGFRQAFMLQGTVCIIMLGLCSILLPDWGSEARRAKSTLEKMREGIDAISIDDVTLDELEKIRDASDSVRPSFCSGPFPLLYAAYIGTTILYYLCEAEVMPILSASLPHDSFVLTWAVPACIFMNGLSRLTWGLAGTNQKASLCMVASFSLVAVGVNLWGYMASSPWFAFIGALVCFGGSASLYPLMPIAITRIFGMEQAPMLVALFNTADALASIIGAPCATALAEHVGWSFTLHLSTIVAGIVIALLLAVSKWEEVPPSCAHPRG